MKKRVLTGIIGAAAVIPVFVFMHTIVFPIFLSLVSLIAVYEVIKATGGKNNLVSVLSCAVAAAIPFAFHFRSSTLNFLSDINIAIIIVPYIMVLFIIMVLMHKKTTFNDIIIALSASAFIPCAMSCLIRLRDVYLDYPESYTKSSGVFLFIFAIFSSWMTDIFAFFTGKAFGKHKLCPEISPKKTVEGAIGGTVCAAIFNLILFLIFDKFFFTLHTMQWWQIIIISVVLSVISMFGDLSASIIKRNHDIKDFGKILPGHGGVMDRFDSCLFVVPALYTAVAFINQVWVLK